MGNNNPFDSNGGNLSGFARGCFDITPSNGAQLTDGNNNEVTAIAIQCTGNAGNISVVWADGSSQTRAIAAGEVIACGLDVVNATGTTATGLVGYRA